MIRGFYSAKLGVLAQQENMNLIANNMANVNTVGFKSLRTSFTDLIYQNLNRAVADQPAMVGHGVKINKTDVVIGQGALSPTSRPFDVALTGEGQYFAVRNAAGDIQYTRAGNFIMSQDEDGYFYLAASNGDRVLNADLEEIRITFEQVEQKDRNEITEPVMVPALDDDGNTIHTPQRDADGNIVYETRVEFGNPYYVDGNPVFPLSEIGVFRFNNPYGLYLVGDNRYVATDTSGEAMEEENPLMQAGYLENSNVEIANEMVKVIEASKAFSFNSRMIQVADEIEQTVNNLR